MVQTDMTTGAEPEQTTTHSPTQEDITENPVRLPDEPPFFPVSEGKLMTLYILSFGLYGFFWFYKNWRLQQKTMDKKIYPMLRAIFSIFFTHSLFRRIQQQASHLEKKHQFNANLLATLFVITIVLSNIIDPSYTGIEPADNILTSTVITIALVLFILSVIPLVRVQATVNRINNDILGYLNHKYSFANYVLIICGSIAWVMIALGLLFNFMGTTVIE